VIAIASCWPPSVAAGSGTTVSQNRLRDALRLAGIDCEIEYTSRFGADAASVAERKAANAALQLDGYGAVIGIDGEGWSWAERRRVPFVAACEAVLAEVLPYESGAAREALAAQAAWEAEAARKADAVLARSEYAAERLAADYGISRDRITVLPIPFDVDGWRAQLPALSKEPLVLAVGHAYPRKNYAQLLEAWPQVVERRPEARLVLVGEGPETPRFGAMAAELPSVELRGHVPYGELLALYARARVFCHPALQENFGIAVLEGVASGAAVVAHRQAAVLETVGGVDGVWIVDATSPAELAAALLAGLDGPAPWPDSRLEGLRRRLDPLTVGRTLAELLESLMRTRSV